MEMTQSEWQRHLERAPQAETASAKPQRLEGTGTLQKWQEGREADPGTKGREAERWPGRRAEAKQQAAL